ncbi:MAG TPA: HK97 family phage prohead protease [Limnochordia bacterium]|nr:HK97 family phage prohead protease [Limnochordia bacterium]
MSAPVRARLLPFHIRSVERTDEGLVIEGIANDTNTTDSYNTRFRFTRECVAKSKGGPVLFNHNKDAPCGRNLDMRDTAEGLWVRDVIHPDAKMPNGIAVADAIESGLLNAFSIRFNEAARVERGKQYDTIVPDYLPEHSIVTLPSNTESTFSPAVRSLLGDIEKTPEGQEVARIYRLAARLEDDAVEENERAQKLASKDAKWSAPSLKDFTDQSWSKLSLSEKKKVAAHFLYVPDDLENAKFSDLKLPYKNTDGEIMLAALRNVASRLPNTDIPEADKTAIEKKLKSLYKLFGEEYPGGEKASKRSRDDYRTERGAGILDFDTLRRRLCELAYSGKMGDQDYDEYPVMIYDDYFVFSDGYSSGRYFKQAYEVGDDGEVSLSGDYVEVVHDWRPVSTSDMGRTREVGASAGLDGLRAHLTHLRAMSEAMADEDCPPATVRFVRRSLDATAADLERLLAQPPPVESRADGPNDEGDDGFERALREAFADDSPEPDDIAEQLRRSLAG